MQSHTGKLIISLAAVLLAMLGCQTQVTPAVIPDSPTVTAVSEATETPDPIQTPAVATVSDPTPCWAGPGEPYVELHTLAPGDTYDVVGTGAAGEYWIIQLAANLQCWLRAQDASIEGDLGKLTEYSPPVGTIRGTITVDEVSKDDSPVEDAEVRLKYDEDSPDAYAWVRTDAAGKYSFDNVPIGDVIILLPTRANTDSIERSVTLTDGETIDNVNFLLSPGVPILRPPDDLNACSQQLICGTPFNELAPP